MENEVKEEILEIRAELEGEIKADIKAIREEVEEIRDNHLAHIYSAIESIWGAVGFLTKSVNDLKWFIMGGFALLAIVVTLISCLT